MNGTETYAKPTPQQLQWAEQEVGVLIHFLMDNYHPEKEHLIKTAAVRTEMPASSFAPQGWDADQWIRCAKSAGARYAILVAKHATGFSLWPTDVHGYSVANCPYPDGKGDVVRDFVDACRKYGLKPGLYYSTGSNGYYGIRRSLVKDWKTEEMQSYVRDVERQITELWTRYGDLFEIWFDGGIVPVCDGGPDAAALLRRYQPNAVCFQGPDEHPHNLRWIGNEDGVAGDDCFSSYPIGADGTDHEQNLKRHYCGDPDGTLWLPAESDIPNRRRAAFGAGWGWMEGQEDMVFSPEHLFQCYLRSVGHNSNLLLGMAIAKNGRFADEEQFQAFGKLVEDAFGEQALLKRVPGTSDPVQTVSLDGTVPISYVVLRENLENGHGVLGFRVLIDGRELFSGHCIGHKRIVCANGLPGKTVTVEITERRGEASLRDIAVY